MIRLPEGSWWDWDVVAWEPGRLSLCADHDLSYHHALELVFTDPVFVSCPAVFHDPVFREASPQEQQVVREATGETPAVLVAFDAEAGGPETATGLIGAGSVEILQGTVLRYWREDLAADQRFAPWVRPPRSGGEAVAPRPAVDSRTRDTVLDHADMDAFVTGLALPADAPMPVLSALETARELLRHASYRYEFATVAVTHALVALEQVLTPRLPGPGPLDHLITRAVDEGLIAPALGERLQRARAVRDDLTHGRVTSAALGPARALSLLRAVFDAVTALLPPSLPTAGQTSLAELWERHRRAPYPDSFRGVEIAGVELILLDADVAALVGRELDGGLGAAGVATLWACIADLDKAVPAIDEAYCAAYFARLRAIAGLAAARHTPAAT